MTELPSFWTSSKVVFITEVSPSLSHPFSCHNWCGTDSQPPVLWDQRSLHLGAFQGSLFSINADLKSSGSARWNLSHGIVIKLSTGLGTQRDTTLIHDTALALEGLTALVWLGDHPTSIRMEKPNLHFGFIVLHAVTGRETRRASVPVEGLGGLQPLSLWCMNSTSSPAAESRWLCVHKHCHFTGTARLHWEAWLQRTLTLFL